MAAIKSNNAIKGFFSKLLVTSDEMAGNVVGQYTKRIKYGEGELSKLKKTIDTGKLKGKGLEEATKRRAILEADIEKQYDNISGIDFEAMGKMSTAEIRAMRNDAYYSNMASATPNYNKDSVGAKLGSGTNMVRDYFAGAGVDASTRAFRRNTAIGGAVGVGLGGRYLSGGSLTHNNQGERDFAIIPFI